jgi:hypothetical protein
MADVLMRLAQLITEHKYCFFEVGVIKFYTYLSKVKTKDMEKIFNVIFLLLGVIFGLNGLYILLFKSNTDYFRVFGMFETNKPTACTIYLAFSIIIIYILRIEKKEK